MPRTRFTGSFQCSRLPCSISSLLIHSDRGMFFSVKSRETLTLRGLESAQKDIESKKLEEQLEKFQIDEGGICPSDEEWWFHGSPPRGIFRETKLSSRFPTRESKKSTGRVPWSSLTTAQRDRAVLGHVLGCNCTSTSKEMINRRAVQKYTAVGSCGWGGTLGIAEHRSFGGGGWLSQELLVCNSDKCFLSAWMMCSSWVYCYTQIDSSHFQPCPFYSRAAGVWWKSNGSNAFWHNSVEEIFPEMFAQLGCTSWNKNSQPRMGRWRDG